MSELPEQAAAWVQQHTGSPVVAAIRLDGATTAAVHRLELADGRQLVSKRFDRQDFLDERPDRAEHEAAVLHMLASTPVPAPQLIAVDGKGDASGVPTVLMTWIEGTPGLPDGWVDAAADNLIDIHRVDPGDLVWPYEPYNAAFELSVPSWASDAGVWREAFAIAEDPPDTAIGFVHRDYHGGNLLWRDGDLAGVFDWLSGCIGPLAIDLAHLRNNLAMDHGHESADAVLHAYLARGRADAWHPGWDVVDAIDFLPYWLGARAVEDWTWDQRPKATTQQRFDEVLTRLVRAHG